MLLRQGKSTQHVALVQAATPMAIRKVRGWGHGQASGGGIRGWRQGVGRQEVASGGGALGDGVSGNGVGGGISCWDLLSCVAGEARGGGL